MATLDQGIEFEDGAGGKVTVPADGVGRYIGVRAEQLTTLTRLMVDATVGNVIEPSEKDLSILTLIINELAHIVEDLLDKMSIDAAGKKEVGNG